MTTGRSAGILLYRIADGPELLLGRMGGPFWSGRRERNWSVPKGELESDEAPLAAARREFAEELGLAVPDVELTDLGAVTQKAGKRVQVFAGRVADLDLAGFAPGTFELEWPRGSGIVRQFPELAEVAWVPEAAARVRLVAAQVEFVDRLLALL